MIVKRQVVKQKVLIRLESEIFIEQSFLAGKTPISVRANKRIRVTIVNIQITFVNVNAHSIISSFEPLFTRTFAIVFSWFVDAEETFLTFMRAKATLVDV